MARIKLTHFSDVLCIWAYVSQIRMDELVAEFGEQIELDCRLFPVFGNAADKIDSLWAGRGGYSAYNRHVREVSAQFSHVNVHPDIWKVMIPHSSLPAHLYLCAVRLLESRSLCASGTFFRMAWAIREAFFAKLADIADASVLGKIFAQHGVPLDQVETCIRSGEAFAVMSGDMQLAREQQIRSSPTLIFNEDRQRLSGNVGYRIIEANIRELLEKPRAGQSWC